MSIEEAAGQMQKTAEDIAGWESGASGPTYKQLEKLAYKVYGLPITVFFFPEPPNIETPRAKFRLVSDNVFAKLSPQSVRLIKSAAGIRDSLAEISGGKNPISKRVWNEVRLPGPRANPQAVARKIRNVLGVTEGQQEKWKSVSDAFKAWRMAVEAVGVFVFKSPIKQTEFSGFCLHDDEFPLIFVNNSNAYTRQIFTLLHELAHVVIKENGITTPETTSRHHLNRAGRSEEVFCNAVAANILLPPKMFARLSKGRGSSDLDVEFLANKFCVSREVILRRMLDLNEIRAAKYESKVKEWTDAFQKRKPQGKGGGNWFLNQATYLSPGYARMTLNAYHAGKIDLYETSRYLGVKARKLTGLEEALASTGATN